MALYEEIIKKEVNIVVVGLGYVGMPIAIEFAKHVRVIGFDTDTNKVNKYISGVDPTKEVGDEAIQNTTLKFTDKECKIGDAKFVIVAVPTPINHDKTPNLTPVISASHTVGRNLARGSVVVYESTVYPGVTEDICIPILEKESGLVCGKDFKVGYSPERINPGDHEHRLTNIKKIVSAIDEESLDMIAKVYEIVVAAGVHRASSIKVAEAAKVVENSQRDINIAFMNELAMIFDRMDIDTNEVIAAMNTKWNSLGFTPGLVGGHCIGVDPYYFIYEAQKLGYHSQIIMSGRKINDSMGTFIADIAIKKMIQAGMAVRDAKVGIFGITFKENCPDTRNSKVIDILNRLQEYGIQPYVYDPIADKEEAMEEYGVEIYEIEEAKDLECAIFTVAHDEFKEFVIGKTLEEIFKKDKNERVLIDVKGIFDRSKIEEKGYVCWFL